MPRKKKAQTAKNEPVWECPYCHAQMTEAEYRKVSKIGKCGKCKAAIKTDA